MTLFLAPSMWRSGTQILDWRLAGIEWATSTGKKSVVLRGQFNLWPLNKPMQPMVVPRLMNTNGQSHVHIDFWNVWLRFYRLFSRENTLQMRKNDPVIDSIITDRKTFSGFPDVGLGIAVKPLPLFSISKMPFDARSCTSSGLSCFRLFRSQHSLG